MTIIDTLQKLLIEIGWDPEPTGDEAGFHVDFGPPHTPIAEAFALVSAGPDQFIFYLNFGPSAPSGRRDEVARYITRVNWGLKIGNFELRFEDGFVRFKSSVDFSNIEHREMLMRNAILAAMYATETYADGLIEVLSGKKNATQAIADAESESA